MDDISKQKQGFEQRFGIEVGLEAAKQRFVNRLFNLIDEGFLGFTTKHCHLQEYEWALKYVAYKLGIRYEGNNTLVCYSGTDFSQVLKALEALYEAFKMKPFGSSDERLDVIIKAAISQSEIDLGVEWRDGLFYQSGAKLLDEALVKENLKWLSDPQYINVLTPFEKGLRHLLEAQKQPTKLSNTVTDMYEALEALAKIVTGRDRDLSGNAESYISKLGLSEHYKGMLKAHIKYANKYRHAPKPSERSKPPLPNEVEAFVYTTGVFIRLAIQQLNQADQTR